MAARSESSQNAPGASHHLEKEVRLEPDAEAVEEILEDDAEDAEKNRETTRKERRGEAEAARETGGREGGDEVGQGEEGEEEEEEEDWEMEEHLTIGDIMNRAIAEQAFPGGTVAFGSFEGPVFHAYSLWDLASLTKIMATVPAAMILYEKGLLDLQAPVHRYLPAFGANGKHVVTVQMLLTHTAGLREFQPFFALQLSTRQQVRASCPITSIQSSQHRRQQVWSRGLRGMKGVCIVVRNGRAVTVWNGKHVVTVHMLLTHTAGLREFHPFFALQLSTRHQVIDFIMADHLWYPPIVTTRYSDLSMIVLALVIERITGCHLSTFVHREIFSRLGMTSTAFRPIPGHHGSTFRPIGDSGGVDPRVVPTEVDSLHRKKLLWGEGERGKGVHDPTAWIMGGVAGHAGLFSTILDVTKFARCMLAGGTDPTTGHQLVSSRTLHVSTSLFVALPLSDSLRWDVASRRGKDGYTSAGRFMGPRTFGHTGFTGETLWYEADALYILEKTPTSVGRFMGPCTFGHTGFTVATLGSLALLLLNLTPTHTSATQSPSPIITITLSVQDTPTALTVRDDTPTALTVRDVRPLIANAAVTTLGQLGLPRRTLTWHLGSQPGTQTDAQIDFEARAETVADTDVESGVEAGAEAGARAADGTTWVREARIAAACGGPGEAIAGGEGRAGQVSMLIAAQGRRMGAAPPTGGRLAAKQSLSQHREPLSPQKVRATLQQTQQCGHALPKPCRPAVGCGAAEACAAVDGCRSSCMHEAAEVCQSGGLCEAGRCKAVVVKR
ncbi:unnamed protein product [Closterium sp. NIES-65]|nr:unnamed protein product [Closterium sp. NIES-65]